MNAGYNSISAAAIHAASSSTPITGASAQRAKSTLNAGGFFTLNLFGAAMFLAMLRALYCVEWGRQQHIAQFSVMRESIRIHRQFVCVVTNFLPSRLSLSALASDQIHLLSVC
jgi:hypothetical protein